ncbi:MAG: DUF1302 family protein [Deltaproteobacteria bacterium]
MLHRYHAKRHELALAMWVGFGASVFTRATAAQEGPGGPIDSSEDLTETIPSGDGDLVESIEPSGDSPEAASPTSAGEPEAKTKPDARVTLSGYARQSLELVYGELARESRTKPEGTPPCPTDPTPCLWRDVFLSRTQLLLRATYLQRRHFEATVSGVLGYTLHVAQRAHRYSAGIVDLARGELDPQLREAYLGFFWPAVDLRIGQQRVAWGRADFQSPNDVINARDLRDPFFSETELRHQPTPLIRSSVTVGPVTFEGVVSPFFIPDRFDVYGSNWAAIQGQSPSRYQEFLGAASLLVDPSVEREFAQLWQQTARPLDNGKGTSAGARIFANLSGIDLSAYYHYGYDRTPYVRLDPVFMEYLRGPILADGQPAAEPRFPPGDAAPFGPVPGLINDLRRNGGPIAARYLRRHHVGFDLAAPLGPIVLRLDAAYQSRRVFYRLDLNSFATPALLGVATLEYQIGNLDDLILLEFLAQHLLHEPVKDPATELPLLAYERTTTAVAATLRWALGESWGVDLRALIGIHPETYVLQPALRYKASDSLTLRLGALILSGAERSFGWAYSDNDSAFIQLRYAF